MSFFTSITSAHGPLDADNTCSVTLTIGLPDRIRVDFIDVYLEVTHERLVTIDPAKAVVQFKMSPLLYSGIDIYPRQKSNGAAAVDFDLGNGNVVSSESLFDSFVVELPRAPSTGDPNNALRFTPSTPSNVSLEIRDGSLMLHWNYHDNGRDLDHFQISIQEGTQEPQYKTLDADARGFIFSPTKNDTRYVLGVRSQNIVTEFAWAGKDPYFSPWVYAGAHVDAVHGWPPENRWQTFELIPPPTHARPGLCAVSRKPAMMDVFWTETLSVGFGSTIHSYHYEDGSGWRGGVLQQIGGPRAKIACVARTPDTIDVFFPMFGGGLQHGVSTSQNAWRYENIALSGSVADGSQIVALSRHPSHVEAFYITPTGEVRNAYWNEGQSAFGSDVIAPSGSAAPEGKITGISRIPGSMELFFIAPNGAVKNAFWYEGQGWKLGEIAPAGSGSKFAIACASRIASNMEVFWVGPRMSLEHAYYYDGEGWKRDQRQGDMSVSPLSGLAALSRQDSHIECWWSDPMGLLKNNYWNEGVGWGSDTLPTIDHWSMPTFCTNITAVSRFAETIELFATTTLGTIQDAYIYFR